MRIRKNVAISDSGLVFNPVSGESFTVNPIGLEILQLIREEKSPDQISAKLLSRYQAEKTTLEKDIQDFIGMLRHHQLIEEHEEKKA